MSVDEIESMLNHQSGVWGLAGENDFRRLRQMIESDDGSAQLAYDVFIHRLRKYIGAYLAVLGHTDVLTFTAGVGENAAEVRRDALAGYRSWASCSTRAATSPTTKARAGFPATTPGSPCWCCRPMKSWRLRVIASPFLPNYRKPRLFRPEPTEGVGSVPTVRDSSS